MLSFLLFGRSCLFRGVKNLTNLLLTAFTGYSIACIPCELDYKVGFIELHFRDVDLHCQNWFCVLTCTTAASTNARRYCEVNVHSGNVCNFFIWWYYHLKRLDCVSWCGGWSLQTNAYLYKNIFHPVLCCFLSHAGCFWERASHLGSWSHWKPYGLSRRGSDWAWCERQAFEMEFCPGFPDSQLIAFSSLLL